MSKRLYGVAIIINLLFLGFILRQSLASDHKLSYLLKNLINIYTQNGLKMASQFALTHDLQTRDSLVRVILVIDSDSYKDISDDLTSNFENKVKLR